MKVPLLENISAVADEIFRGAGYQVESEEAALDERKLIANPARGLDSGVRSTTRITAAGFEAASEAGGGGCLLHPSGQEFRGMKDGACCLNLSLRFVVDHEALPRHLKSGKVAGAAIDVFPKEPEWRGICQCAQGLRNVILTPQDRLGASLHEQRQKQLPLRSE